MIEHVKHKKVDLRKWDAAVNQNQEKHNWFMQSWYLNAVVPNWSALVYKDYKMVFPVVNRWRGLPYYYQPFFTRAYEILGGDTNEVLEKDFYSKLKGSMCYGQINIENSHFLNLNAKYQWLDLNLCEYSQNTKRNIKKAEKAGVKINDIDIEAFIDFYRTQNSAKFSEYKNKHYKQLYNLLSSAQERGFLQLKSSGVKTTEAVAAYLLNSDKALYLCAAISKEGKRNGVSHYLIHHFIESNKHKLNSLDFGGSNVDGVARFYKSFGATDKEYSVMPLGLSNK